MDWGMIGAVSAIAALNISVTVFIMNWIRSDLKTFEAELRTWNKDILMENRDFHARMSVIEDRNNRSKGEKA